jgi:hypothetical protein
MATYTPQSGKSSAVSKAGNFDGKREVASKTSWCSFGTIYRK